MRNKKLTTKTDHSLSFYFTLKGAKKMKCQKKIT